MTLKGDFILEQQGTPTIFPWRPNLDNHRRFPAHCLTEAEGISMVSFLHFCPQSYHHTGAPPSPYLKPQNVQKLRRSVRRGKLSNAANAIPPIFQIPGGLSWGLGEGESGMTLGLESLRANATVSGKGQIKSPLCKIHMSAGRRPTDQSTANSKGWSIDLC